MRGISKIAGAQLFLALSAIVLLNTGCLTPALWQEHAHRVAYEPGLSLAVVHDSTNVLVQYNEYQSDKVKHRSYWYNGYQSDKGKCRSYWLFEYGTGFNGKPRFVSPKEYADLELIPIPLSGEKDVAPAAGYIAVSTVGQRSFELRRDGVLVGNFYLPDYDAYAIPTFGRVALTPVAVVGDTAIVAGVIVGCAGLIYLQAAHY